MMLTRVKLGMIKNSCLYLEDFYLPRREGARYRNSTLPGGQNLGEITDIQYFQKKLYKKLGVPETRLGGEGGFQPWSFF